MIWCSLNLLFRIEASSRHSRPETSSFQWPGFKGWLQNKWKSRKFEFYTDNADFPKMDVLEATVNVATSLELRLLKSTQKSLQKQVSLGSTPGDVLPHMS